MLVTGASQVVLVVHPQTPAALPVTLLGEARRLSAAVLRCDFVLEADLTRFALPARGGGARRDELWQHTCFETFVGTPDASGYCEFNFSPSGDWAAYQFEDYRRGRAQAPLRTAPALQVDERPGRLTLSATLELGGVAALERAPQLRLALAAVLEDGQGSLSYWALRHAPGPPDFHHRAGSTLKLHAP
ncbi:MAG TPA: DOMON-like domain-containing protein [Steroidobacteraceae bacterium]|nr:DOMON-like domain-containing protein [Steroidobacteraceae bacterium]